VNIRGDEGLTPLHSAAFHGQVDVVRFLLDHSADVNSQTDHGWTALHYLGVTLGFIQGPNVPQKLANVAQLLLEHGADINARNHRGWTPLHVAAFHANVTVARMLLEHGAKVDEENNSGKTPFQLALEWKHNEMIKLLSEHGCQELPVESSLRLRVWSTVISIMKHHIFSL